MEGEMKYSQMSNKMKDKQFITSQMLLPKFPLLNQTQNILIRIKKLDSMLNQENGFPF